MTGTGTRTFTVTNPCTAIRHDWHTETQAVTSFTGWRVEYITYRGCRNCGQVWDEWRVYRDILDAALDDAQ